MRPKTLTARSLAAVFTLSLACRAAAETATDEARQHFAHGVELAETGALPEAVLEFQRAYQASPHFSVLYNLGQAYVGLDKPVEAVDALTKYLTEGGDKVPADRRAEVLAEIRRQTARLATVTLLVDPAGATTYVDGRDIGKSPLEGPLRLVAGPHTFSANLTGFATDQQTLNLAGEQVTTVALRLVPAAPAPTSQPGPPMGVPVNVGPPAWPVPAQGPPPPRDASTDPGSVQRTIGYVVGGLGIVGLGVGTGFGLSARGKGLSRNRVAEGCANHCTDADIARASAFQGDAQSAATAANVFLIGGGFVTAAGLVLVLTAPSEHAPGDSVGVQAAPWVSPDSVGVGTRGTF